jgi:RecJ-like exonuclease
MSDTRKTLRWDEEKEKELANIILDKQCSHCGGRGHTFGASHGHVTMDMCQSCNGTGVSVNFTAQAKTADPVNSPSHYTGHPSGIEAIQVTEHFDFCKGNAIKYIWRSGHKGNEIEDLEKAVWYIQREIARLRKAGA